MPIGSVTHAWVALETIKVATEEGIKWHVEEHAEQKEV